MPGAAVDAFKQAMASVVVVQCGSTIPSTFPVALKLTSEPLRLPLAVSRCRFCALQCHQSLPLVALALPPVLVGDSSTLLYVVGHGLHLQMQSTNAASLAAGA